jgi:hypothetical protein
MPKISALEKDFLFKWKLANGPKLTPEHRFHGSRLWRFDFALPDLRIAFEIEGGVWSGGRHTRGYGFVKDADKYLAAFLLGWTVVRLTAYQLHLGTIKEIVAVVKKGGAR